MDRLAPEILDNVLDFLPEDEKTTTLQSLSLVNKYLRDLANRKKFSKVRVLLGRVIDDGNPGGHRYIENPTSQTFKLLQLIQESVDIAPHIRTLAFSVVDIDSKQPETLAAFPEGYEHYRPFASIPIIISMAHNLRCISFPATRYDQAADWNLDIPPELRDAFIKFYSQRGPTLKSKVDITGIKNFPKELLSDIPNIDELCARPLLVSDAASNGATAGHAGVVLNNPRVLKLRALGLEVPWGLGQSWEQFVQLFRPPSSFADLTSLETLNVSYYESHLLELNKLLRPCAATLKHVYLRVGSLTNGTTSRVNWETNEIMNTFTTGVPDFICLRNLRTLTIVGLVYNAAQYCSEYKTQAHWIASVLTSLIQSPAYTTTLREIHLCFTIGHFPDSIIQSIDWSPITDVLERNFTQSRLEQISFNFRERGPFGETKYMSQGPLQNLRDNSQIRALTNRTGIVVVKSELAFSA